MRRLLAGLILLAALPCFGQSAAPLSASSGTLAERTMNSTQSGLYYLPTNPPTLTTVTATALATPGSITVTPVLTKVASITTVAGSALADGDYFTVEYASGLTVPIEFDLSPGDGTTGGRVPLLFTAGDSADLIRDNLILLLNSAVPAQLTASSGGAATVSIVLDTPGAVGGTLTENVTNAGFGVSGFANPTAATTVTYRLVAHLADGTATEAGAASSTAASTATLSASNLLRLTWSAVPGAASYTVYRTVAPTSPATTGKVIANTALLTLDDTGLAGGGETAPTVGSTGRLVSTALTTGRIPLVSTGGAIVDDAGLTYTGTGDAAVIGAGSIELKGPGSAAGYMVRVRKADDSLLWQITDGGGIYARSGTAHLASSIITWSDSNSTWATPATSLSRIADGVIGVGTGAAGNIEGAIRAGTGTFRGSNATRVWLQGGIPGQEYLASGNSAGLSSTDVRTAMVIGSFGVSATDVYGWTDTSGTGYSNNFDLILTRRAAATFQLGAADSATPVAQTLAVQSATGTNVAGQPFTVQASLGTGTAGGGDYKIRTAPREATGSTQNTPSDRLVLAAKQVTLTESSATPILDVAVASGTVAGGEVLYTIRADDATDFQALTGRVQWSAVNKGGTLTAAINLVGTETVAVSAGTLTNTATITTGTNSITINLAAVSSLTQTTLYAYVQSNHNGVGNATTK